MDTVSALSHVLVWLIATVAVLSAIEGILYVNLYKFKEKWFWPFSITVALLLAAAASSPSISLPPAPGGETVFSAPATALATSPLEAQTPPRLLQLRTSEASWIEVRDAKGVLLLSRTVLPSESVGLDGQLPIRLTIGNASATQVQFRGQLVDLSTRTRDNVARVEVQ